MTAVALAPREPWHYLPTMATPEEARAIAEALGTQVSWMVKTVGVLAAHGNAVGDTAAHQTETIAWLIVKDAAHYGLMALGER